MEETVLEEPLDDVGVVLGGVFRIIGCLSIGGLLAMRMALMVERAAVL